MDLKERNRNEKYEQEILKAHEKLYPRKKRIAHNSPNSHFDNVSNQLFDQQNLADLNELLGVQDVDFEKLQPRSKSRCIQKGKMKTSFPLLQKSQKHLKYIKHNVYSASKQRAHVSLIPGEQNTIKKSNRNEEQDCDFQTENFEGFYTQGIAESVKNRGRFKHGSETNSTDSNNLKVKLNFTESSEIRTNGRKEKGNCGKSSDIDKCKFYIKNTSNAIQKEQNIKQKNDSKKHKNMDSNDKNLESSKHKGTIKHKHKHKDKGSKEHKDKSSRKHKDKSKKYDSKVSKHKVNKHKVESPFKHKSKPKFIQNSAEKEECENSEQNLCFEKNVKLKPCSVQIEQCPEISFMLQDVSLPTISQKTQQLDERRNVQNSEAVLSENEGEDNVPMETNDMDDSSDDDIMIIEECPSQFRVKISHSFSIKQECETDLESTDTQPEIEKSVSAPQLEIIDLSDDNMSDIEIVDVKANESNKNIFKKIAEKSNDSTFISVPSASSGENPNNVLHNILSENEVSSCTSKILSPNNDFDETSLKVPFKDQIIKSRLTDLEMKLGNVKCEESEDEMDDSISKILDLEGVSEPSISPLIELFEKESRDLKNIQNAARNYSNVAEGLKMLECEKLKRLKFMKCALKKFHTKQVSGNKINFNQKNELDSKSIKCSKPPQSISTTVNEYLKNGEQQGVTEAQITDPCSSIPTVRENSIPIVEKSAIPTVGKSSIPTVEKSAIPTVGKSSIPTVEKSAIPTVKNYTSNLVQNSSSHHKSDDDELEILTVYNSKSPVAANSVNVQNPIVSPHSLLGKEKTAFERTNSFGETSNSQIDVFKSNPYGFTSNTITTVHKPSFLSVKNCNSQEINTFVKSPITRSEISQPIPSSTVSADKIRLSNFGSYQHSSQDHNRVSSAIGQFCQICRKRAAFACQGCSKVYFCSNECGVSYWNNGHFAECG